MTDQHDSAGEQARQIAGLAWAQLPQLRAEVMDTEAALKYAAIIEREWLAPARIKAVELNRQRDEARAVADLWRTRHTEATKDANERAAERIREYAGSDGLYVDELLDLADHIEKGAKCKNRNERTEITQAQARALLEAAQVMLDGLDPVDARMPCEHCGLYMNHDNRKACGKLEAAIKEVTG